MQPLVAKKLARQCRLPQSIPAAPGWSMIQEGEWGRSAEELPSWEKEARGYIWSWSTEVMGTGPWLLC